jgi:chitinase
MNLLKFISVTILATQLIACGGGGGVALGALVGALSPNSSVNEAPIANAGITQNVTLGFVGGVSSKVVTLDGTGSTDPNNNPLTFAWSLTKPAGSAAVLSSPTSPKPTFTADIVGTYTATLIVKDDGTLESKVPSIVTIVASVSNSAPVANAGGKQFVVFGTSSTVTLDGTYSNDDDNDQLTYNWTLLQKPEKSTAILSSNISSRPTFKADLAGDYVAQLIVNDGKVNSAPTSVIVVAGAENVRPKANAGDDKNAIVNTLVSLDGTNSFDPNSDPLTSYQWDWMSSPGTAPALSLAIPSRPTFTPTRTGIYVLTLTVSDGKLNSLPDPITITVTNVSGAF